MFDHLENAPHGASSALNKNKSEFFESSETVTDATTELLQMLNHIMAAVTSAF